MPKVKAQPPVRVWARVTVGMAGAPRGRLVLVDPANPDIAALIAAKALVIEEDSDD